MVACSSMITEHCHIPTKSMAKKPLSLHLEGGHLEACGKVNTKRAVTCGHMFKSPTKSAGQMPARLLAAPREDPLTNARDDLNCFDVADMRSRVFAGVRGFVLTCSVG